MVDEKDIQGEIDALLKSVFQKQEEKPTAQEEPPKEKVQELKLEEFKETKVEPRPANLKLLEDVSVDIRVELGRSLMRVGDILKISPGSIIELEKLTGDPLDIYINNALIARGEVLVIGENFAIRIKEIVQSQK